MVRRNPKFSKIHKIDSGIFCCGVKMSTLSLPRFLNGSTNSIVNLKFMSLNRTSPQKRQFNGPSKFDYELIRRKKTLNRNGSIARNYFRGVKKEFLEKQTDLICHALTVRFMVIIKYLSCTYYVLSALP